MPDQELSLQEKEAQFYHQMVTEYLKYGSVDEVFRQHDYLLPISFASFHRLLDKWGIVKTAGPNSKLSEAICFLQCLFQERIPLETLYRRMPPSFQTSMSTLHRILHYVKEGVTRRVGVALAITPENHRDQLLIGNDLSTPRLELGKPFGSISLPMGYAKEKEESETSILRILQREVFTQQTIDQTLPGKIISGNPKPFMFVDIVDVRVAVYHLILPTELTDPGLFSSFKLKNHRFLETKEISEGSDLLFRTGIIEIARGYEQYQTNKAVQPVFTTSILNQQLLQWAAEYSRVW